MDESESARRFFVFLLRWVSIFFGEATERKERTSYITSRQRLNSSKVNSFSVNYTAKPGAVLMIHSVIAHEKRSFELFFSTSSLRFAAGSRWIKIIEIQVSSSVPWIT